VRLEPEPEHTEPEQTVFCSSVGSTHIELHFVAPSAPSEQHIRAPALPVLTAEVLHRFERLARLLPELVLEPNLVLTTRGSPVACGGNCTTVMAPCMLFFLKKNIPTKNT